MFKTKNQILNHKVYIFGLDGNLINSFPIHLKTAEKTFRMIIESRSTNIMPKEYYAKLYKKTSGLPTSEQFTIAFKEVRGKNPDTKLANKFEKKFNKQIAQKTSKAPLMPGAKQLLKFLKRSSQCTLVISTSHNINDIPQLIKGTGLDKYVDIILAQGGVYKKTKKGWGIETKNSNFKKGKPYFEYLKKKLHIKSSQIVYIASTPGDIDKAKTEKCIVIGIAQIKNLNQIKAKKTYLVYNSLVEFFETIKDNKISP